MQTLSNIQMNTFLTLHTKHQDIVLLSYAHSCSQCFTKAKWQCEAMWNGANWDHKQAKLLWFPNLILILALNDVESYLLAKHSICTHTILCHIWWPLSNRTNNCIFPFTVMISSLTGKVDTGASQNLTFAIIIFC